MNHRLALAILLAAVVSLPLALAAVMLHWTAVDAASFLREGLSPAMWSARKFLAYFDVSMFVMYFPCAALISRFIGRRQLQLAAAAE